LVKSVPIGRRKVLEEDAFLFGNRPRIRWRLGGRRPHAVFDQLRGYGVRQKLNTHFWSLPLAPFVIAAAIRSAFAHMRPESSQTRMAASIASKIRGSHQQKFTFWVRSTAYIASWRAFLSVRASSAAREVEKCLYKHLTITSHVPGCISAGCSLKLPGIF
jgi:hypothetical protein